MRTYKCKVFSYKNLHLVAVVTTCNLNQAMMRALFVLITATIWLIIQAAPLATNKETSKFLAII